MTLAPKEELGFDFMEKRLKNEPTYLRMLGASRVYSLSTLLDLPDPQRGVYCTFSPDIRGFYIRKGDFVGWHYAGEPNIEDISPLRFSPSGFRPKTIYQPPSTSDNYVVVKSIVKVTDQHNHREHLFIALRQTRLAEIWEMELKRRARP